MQVNGKEQETMAGNSTGGTSLAEWLRTGGIAARNVLLGGNLRALPLLLQPRRLVHYAGETLFLYQTSQDARELPQRNIAEVLPGPDVESVVLGSLDGDNWLEPLASYAADILALCMLCRRLRPRTVFEVGTLNGYTAYHFALNAPDARVFSLDLPRTAAPAPALRTTAMDEVHIEASLRTSSYCFSGRPEEERIELLFGDSARFDFSPWHGKVDLFFVDGAHSWEYVRSDTQNAFRCVRPGGVIAWHDYGRVGVNGVSRYLHELRAAGHDIHAVPGGSVAFMRVPQ
jgi:predicted O-methyltransferase YrrM